MSGRFSPNHARRILARAEWGDWKQAVDEVVALGGNQARRALEGQLTQAHSLWRQLALDGLARLRDPRCIPAVLRLLRDEHESQVVAAAIAALGVLDDPRVKAPILDALQHKRAVVLTAAARAAGARGYAEARELLESLRGWSHPEPHPDYEPESWLEDRLDRKRESDAEDGLATAVAEALRRLNGVA